MVDEMLSAITDMPETRDSALLIRGTDRNRISLDVSVLGLKEGLNLDVPPFFLILELLFEN